MLFIHSRKDQLTQDCFFYPYRVLKIFLISIFTLISLSGCSVLNSSSGKSKSYHLTSITSSPSSQHYPGKFIWHDLFTSERDKSKQFYGQLFGWTFEDNGDYSVIFNNNKKIGGMLEVKPKAEQDAEAIWIATMSVSNVNQAVSFVKAQGGQVLNGPIHMEKRGNGALVSDPQGAQLILLRAIDGDPVDDKISMGDWLWNEIWTNVPDKTLDFYTQLGQYTSIQHSNTYHILKSEKQWRAGIRNTFNKETKIRWVPSIRVDDPNTLLKKVKQLGGSIVLRPGEHPSSQNTALITDNTGALLMIQQWYSQSDNGVQSQ